MIKIKAEGYRDVANYLDSLRLTPGRRKQLYRKLARKIASFARQNIRKQQTVGGGAMQAPAKASPYYNDGKQRGKMLRRIAKGSNMKAIGEGDKGKVYWSSGLLGEIAQRQQEGATLTRAYRTKKEKAQDGGTNGMATKAQALRLINLRAVIRENGFLPTVDWICANISLKQAGLIIRKMKEKGGDTAPKAWKIPERPFLGVSDEENRQLREIIEEFLMQYAK